MDDFKTQKIEYIAVKDSVLRTENPRDPIDEDATDQEVVERAYSVPQKKWNSRSFAESMGAMYAFSELPTIVYKNGKPVVYDGNRRIALAKIKFGYVNHLQTFDLKIPDYPEIMPCAVCSEELAVERILRKHNSTGSWNALEREKFERKYKSVDKSPFLVVEEALDVISTNKKLNQNFVKDEILTEPNLAKLGFSIKKGQLFSKHSENDSKAIFQNIVDEIRDKSISTRNSRGQVYEVPDDSSKKIIEQDANRPESVVQLPPPSKIETGGKIVSNRYTQRISMSKEVEIFGEKLYLKQGTVNNPYRDICVLYTYWESRKNSDKPLSETFTALICMPLRLLVETAAAEENQDIKGYVNANYSEAKGLLNKDEKTTLSNLISSESGKIIQLLQSGAHNYESACNFAQTKILSVLIAKMLRTSHSAKEM